MQSKVTTGATGQERLFPVVVVGASASGLPPFERLLSVLPKRFGFALVFLQHLSPARADIPVIMCTGFSYLVNAEVTMAAGVRAFVMKPLTKREITDTIRTVIDGRLENWR